MIKRTGLRGLKSQINFGSQLSSEEFIGIIDQDDNETGQVTTRKQMRELNLWHRVAALLVVDEKNNICINKRSMQKDYCPGWLDLTFGGIVSADEIKNPDLAALREAEEELGIPNISQIRIPPTPHLNPKISQSVSTLTP